MAKIKGREMKTQGQHTNVLSKRKLKSSALNLSATLQVVNNSLENEVGIHEQQKTLQA